MLGREAEGEDGSHQNPQTVVFLCAQKPFDYGPSIRETGQIGYVWLYIQGVFERSCCILSSCLLSFLRAVWEGVPSWAAEGPLVLPAYSVRLH